MHGTYERLSLTTTLKRIGYKLCQPLQMLQRIDSPVYQMEFHLYSGNAWVCVRVNDISDTIEHCRANLESGKTSVERRILSVPINPEIVLWLVTIKRVGYGPEVTSPTRNKNKFRHWCFKVKPRLWEDQFWHYEELFQDDMFETQ